MFDEALEQQIVDGSDLVVFVLVQTSRRILFLEAIALEIDEQGRFNRNLVLTDDQALVLANWLI